MKRRVVLLFAALTVIGLAAGALVGKLLAPKDTAHLPPGGDFTLQTAEGPLALGALRGKVVLVYFGYASCPDVCPTSLAFIGQALAMLTEAERAQVRGIFISVDPQRDTPAKLKEYTGYFHANIAGGSASGEALADIARRYGAFYRRQAVDSAVGYVMDHSSVTSVIAPDGRLVEQLPHATPSAAIVLAIRRALER